MPRKTEPVIPISINTIHRTEIMTNAAFGNRFNHVAIVFAGKIWLIGGFDGNKGKGLKDI